MKCKNCTMDCRYRTSDGEKECVFQNHIIQAPDEWRYVRIQAAIAAMQGLLCAPSYEADRGKLNMIAKDAISIADALINELKGEITMATIKSFSDLEQSRKLAEILPLESADMWWSRCTITDFGDGVLKVSYAVEPCNISQFRNTKEDIPCWSLAALLRVLTENKICHYDDRYYCQFMNEGNEFPIYSTAEYDNPVDACVAMIEKLNELKML